MEITSWLRSGETAKWLNVEVEILVRSSSDSRDREEIERSVQEERTEACNAYKL